MNDKILQELSKPFSPASISWLPGSITKDKTKALALAYADLRAYMYRLDEVCGLGWSVSYTPWANKLICHLTIEGVTRSSVGEPTDESERGEIDGTVTEAQAFKRACVMFGLGRYLYNFPQSWQPIDEYKHFTKEAQQKLAKMVHDHYERAINAMPELALSEPVINSVIAAHRTARPPQDTQDVSQKSLGLKNDIDMGMGGVDVPRNSGPVVWPYEVDSLAYMLQHARLALTGKAKDLAHWYMMEDSASGDKRLSIVNKDGKGGGQYGLLTGKLDAKYGKGSHRAILSVLCNRVVTGEDAPGWKCKVLVDWLMDEVKNEQKIKALDGVVIALRETLQVAASQFEADGPSEDDRYSIY